MPEGNCRAGTPRGAYSRLNRIKGLPLALARTLFAATARAAAAAGTTLLAVTPVAFSALGGILRGFLSIAAQRAPYIVAFTELPSSVPPDVPLVAFVRLDQFAWHSILQLKLVIPEKRIQRAGLRAGGKLLRGSDDFP
jgi:hypothetical protein